jgi:multiple sugar transport system permease protein
MSGLRECRGVRVIPSRWERLKNDQTALAVAFLAPTVLVLASVVVYPFLSAVWISFEAKQAGTPGRFVGLQNYVELLGNPVFIHIIGNTIFYTGMAVAIKFTLGLAAALVLAQARPLNGVYRTILFVPWAIPTVIAALNWRWVYDEFSGLLNNALLTLGLIRNVVAWLAEPHLAMWCVIAVAVWTGTPFYTMSFLAGLQAIPRELYEAARLDGASPLQEFRYVTVPGMQAVFLVTVMLSTVFTSTSLVIVNILTNGAPAERTNILPNFSFNLAIGTGRLGIASAVNMIFFPILVVVIIGLSRRLLAARVG